MLFVRSVIGDSDGAGDMAKKLRAIGSLADLRKEHSTSSLIVVILVEIAEEPSSGRGRCE